MIPKIEIKCLISLLYFVEVINCTILLIELKTRNHGETDDKYETKDQVFTTNRAAWVKRIVPTNYKSPKYEYDSRFKTVFAPKYRVHKRKIVESKEKAPMSLDELLLQPFKTETPRKTRNQDIIKSINRILEKLKYVKRETSQTNDDLRHGEDTGYKEESPHVPFNFPHYSIWNHWTYDRNLLHDECPGQQVKVGTLCIWAPPHRK